MTALSRLWAGGIMMIGAALAVTIALGLIIVQLVGLQEVRDGVACQLGFSQECLWQELQEERRELREMRKRTAELEALHARLAALEHASSSYTLFSHDRNGSHQVSTGIRFASLLEPDQLVAGWCYIELGVRNGIDTDLPIARFDDDLRVQRHDISAAALRQAGLDRDDITDALTRCAWPDVVRGNLS